MKQQRALFRLSIHRTGTLIRGTEVIPCEVLDLTDKGVLVEASCSAAVGDELQLEFPLTSTATIRCTISVTHHVPPHLGGRIAAISRDDQQRLSRFIDQLLQLNVTGF